MTKMTLAKRITLGPARLYDLSGYRFAAVQLQIY